MTTTEHTFSSEADARAARRAHINQGQAVSLLAFDPVRDLYVFDLTGRHARPAKISPLNLFGLPVYIGQHVWYEERPGVWVEYKVTGYHRNGDLDADVLGQPGVGGRFTRRELHPTQAAKR